jgi:hypothetical protein
MMGSGLRKSILPILERLQYHTPLHTLPEVVTGEHPITAATDMWALGASIFVIAANTWPHSTRGRDIHILSERDKALLKRQPAFATTSAVWNNMPDEKTLSHEDMTTVAASN